MKLYRSALMAGLLALGVAACGDDVEVVSPAPPAPPPTPPVTATMAPASASVAVGNSVVFAVNASGGVAGESASWTCSSSNTGIATVSSTSAGCQATGVVAGAVTITAAVSKSGETVNVGAELTVTSDEVVGGGGEPAIVYITTISPSGGAGITEARELRGRVDVAINIVRGDQTPAALALLVDSEVVTQQSFVAGPPAMQAQEEGDEPAEQATGQLVITLSFDSDTYDETTGVPKYLNGDHSIRAVLDVVGSMEHILSNEQIVEFDNIDGIHVEAEFPGNSAVNPTTGEIWYGGPGGSIFNITAVPVMYSAGGAVESVGVRDFCGADLATKTEAPFTFALDCEKQSKENAEPVFVVAVDGRTLPQDQSGIKNDDDDIFPINLDFKGPTAPAFKVNPNSRQGGWINAAVNMTGETGSGAKANGWLYYYDDDDDGVGGYNPQLRYSANDPSVVASARAATPSENPVLPAETTKGDRVCFIVTATDDLGNESAIPSASKGCMAAGAEGKVEDDGTVMAGNEGSGYGALVTELKRALAKESADDIKDARTALKDAGLQAGVDITPPTAVFLSSGLDEDSRVIDDNFVVEVEDNKDASGIQTGSTKGAPKALVASLEIRDADGTECFISKTGAKFDEVLNEPSSNTRLCKNPFNGLDIDRSIVTTTINGVVEDYTGYYTFTAQAKDKAGNLSEEISRVALNDVSFDARASLRVNPDREDDTLYTLDVTLDDDLSVRDYWLGASVAADVGESPGETLPTVFTDVAIFSLGPVEEVDAYNVPDFTADYSVSEDIELDFLALHDAAGDNPVEIEDFSVYVRDQRGAASVEADWTDDDSPADVADIGAPGPYSNVTLMLAVDNDGGTEADPADDRDDITLTATVTVPSSDDTDTRQLNETHAPFKRVYFYAESSEHNDGPRHWRLIHSLGKGAYERRTAGDNTYVYEAEVDAGDFYDIVDDEVVEDDMEQYAGRVIAIGVWEDLDAMGAIADDPLTTEVTEPTDDAEAAVPGVTGLVAVDPDADDVVHIDL